MKILNDFFEHPMNLNSFIGGVIIAEAALSPIVIALIAVRVFTVCESQPSTQS
jgi:hypothetical protein